MQNNGKVLRLYTTIHDFMRVGHRLECNDLECDFDGIVGDKNYESGQDILLISKSTYDIIDEAELVLEEGVLMENIYIDIDLYHLKKDSIIKIGQSVFEVTGSCEAYNYLYGFAPELPELIRGKRGLFLSAVDYGRIEVGDEVSVLEEK